MMRHRVLVCGKPYDVTIRRWSSRVWTAAAEFMDRPVETAGGSAQLALCRWLQAATRVSNELALLSVSVADDVRVRTAPTPAFTSLDRALEAQASHAVG